MCGSIEITFILNNTKHTCFSMRHTVHSLPLILFALRTMLWTVSMLAACFGYCCCCWSRRFTRANALLCGIETICMYALTILSIFKIANECVNNTRDSLCIDDVWFQSCIYMSDGPAVFLSLYLLAGLVSLSLSVISVIFFFFEYITSLFAALLLHYIHNLARNNTLLRRHIRWNDCKIC